MLPFPLMEFFFDTSRTVVNLILNRVPQKYPNIRFLIPHAGAVLPILGDRLSGLSAVLPGFDDVDVRGSLQNMYYDLAGMIFPTQIENLNLLGVPKDHLLYGSDGTFTPMPLCLKLAEKMDLMEGVEKIYLRNPEKLFA